MPLIKKVDVKNYFASRNRHGIHLHRPASQPDATGFSGEPSTRASSGTGNVVGESVNQPSVLRPGITPPTAASKASSITLLEKSKSVQA